MRSIGNKNTILLGLGFQILQLAWYGFGSEPWYAHFTLGCILSLFRRVRVQHSQCSCSPEQWLQCCFAGWCGQLAPWPPCPASPSRLSAPWSHELLMPTSRVGLLLVLGIRAEEYSADRHGGSGLSAQPGWVLAGQPRYLSLGHHVKSSLLGSCTVCVPRTSVQRKLNEALQ